MRQRSAAVLIVSMGGMGKTCLAREVADYCLKQREFDAAVWVSDKDQLGSTTLSNVLDEIARTLDYPGYTQLGFEEKRREVEQLLRRQRVLLIVDNFETINDGSLLSWLLRLPEPSKTIITSREYSRAFRSNVSVVDLRGLTEKEAGQYVKERLRFLKLENSISSPDQLIPLLAVTGGNPKAIGMALGCIKYERRSLQQVVDDLYSARGDIFDDLFTRCWSLLDEAARRVLLSMTFSVDSVLADALSTTADVKGYVFERSIERLAELSLLDFEQNDLNVAPRYSIHSLVHVFIKTKLGEFSDFKDIAFKRWCSFFLDYCSKHMIREELKQDKYWNNLLVDPSKSKLVDKEWNNIFNVLKWLVDEASTEFISNQEYKDKYLIEYVILFAHFMNSRFLIMERIEFGIKAAEAANRLGQPIDEVILRSAVSWSYKELKDFVAAIVQAEIAINIITNIQVELNAENIQNLLVNARYQLAECYIGLGQLEQASKELDGIDLNNCRYFIQERVYMALGNLAIAKKDYSLARQYYLKAAYVSEAYYQNSNKHFRWSVALSHLYSENLNEAETYFKQMLEAATLKIGSNFKNTSNLVFARYGLAKIAYEHRDFQRAVKLCEVGLEEASRLPKSHELAQQLSNLLLEIKKATSK